MTRASITIRAAQVDTDVPAITDIILQSGTEQATEEEVRKWLNTSAPRRIALHRVAVDEQEQVIGYSNAIHTASSPAGHFYAWVAVNPPLRRRGTGSAVWNCLLAELEGLRAEQVVVDVLEKDPASLAFARKRGFAVDRHKFHSTLDLTTFDETPFLPGIAALETGGIRFCTLADFPDDEETRRKYYELNLATVRDIPGEYWDFAGYPQFFQEQILGAAWFRRERQILAVDGEIFAGFASVSLNQQAQAAYNATTGVIRDYRGQGIGLALKVLAARYAKSCGARLLATDNDSLNAPILAINLSLGYRPEPGKFVLKRLIGGGG